MLYVHGWRYSYSTGVVVYLYCTIKGGGTSVVQGYGGIHAVENVASKEFK